MVNARLKGKMKEQWGELTDDHLTVIEARNSSSVGFRSAMAAHHVGAPAEL
jgi:hypothetical protein